MNILIIGQGGREHALGWKLAQSPGVRKLYFAPGNSGTIQLGTNLPMDLNDPLQLCRVAQEKHVGLVVFGKFSYLELGLSDAFSKAGIKVFGPSGHASELEGSKIFSKTKS